MKIVTQYYLEGIREGREVFELEGIEFAEQHIDNLNEAIKGFNASSPVGQLLRGERDFWKNQLKNKKK